MATTKKTIFVIDDEPANLEFISSELSRHGYSVMTAVDGPEALRKMQAVNIDAVLLDFKMPVMNGLEVLSEIKRRCSGIEVIMMTGYGSVESAVEAMRRGAFGYLQKPLRMEEVIALLEKTEERRNLQKKLNDYESSIETLRRKIEELKEIQNSLEKHQDDLLQSEKLQTIARLVSGVAHEINNPLTAVIGYAQLLKETGGQDFERQIKIILEQAHRCGRIVQDLTIFAKKRTVYPGGVSIKSLLEDASRSLASEIENRKVRFLMEISKAVLEVPGDALQLKKVFHHLIVNALYAVEGIPGKKEVRVIAEDAGDWIQIKIEDNGMGIAKENLNRVFDPFFTTRETGQGSGLGLSIAYGIIQEHGGTIRVESLERRGALFTIQLPKKMPAAASQNPKMASNHDPSLTPIRRVLIIEDEFVIVQLIQRILASYGIQSVSAPDGESGLKAALLGDYDLALCDFRMAKINGLEIIEKVYERNPEWAARFILMTGSVNISGAGEGDYLKKRKITHLSKPFTSEEFLRVLKNKAASTPSSGR